MCCDICLVQIADCVFYSDLKRQGRCTLILVFNGGCNRERFYGAWNTVVTTYILLGGILYSLQTLYQAALLMCETFCSCTSTLCKYM